MMDTPWIIFIGIFIFGSCSSKCPKHLFRVNRHKMCFSVLNCFSEIKNFVEGGMARALKWGWGWRAGGESEEGLSDI